MTQDDDAFVAEIRSLLNAGRKIEAIKRYREHTGSGLAEAKKAVEMLEAKKVRPPAASVDEEIIARLEEGRKIQAIKLYREKTGVGLKEAKEAVEAIAAERGIAASSRGCLGLVLALVFCGYWWLA